MRPITLVILLYLSFTLIAPVNSAAQAPGTITTVAGGIGGEGGLATDTVIFNPDSVAIDAAGNVFVSDHVYSLVRRIDAQTGVISTVAGLASQARGSDGGPATSALVGSLLGLAFDHAGNLFLAEAHRVRRIDAGADGFISGAPDEIITTVAGGGNGGDGGSAMGAYLSRPQGIVFGPLGDLYVADIWDNRVRKVNPGADGLVTGASDEIITTVAGIGIREYSGDGGPATEAALWEPKDVVLDTSGDLYITTSNRIRRVDGTTGIITTFYTGATSPGMVMDEMGNMYFSSGDRVRKIDPSGVITTVAGNGQSFPLGDGGPATSAAVRTTRDLTIDADGNLYLADGHNLRVRRVDAGADREITGASDEIITTIAGGGTLGDGGPATGAALQYPFDLAVDAAGSVYVVNVRSFEARIRRIDPSGTITTVVGGGSTDLTDGVPATSVRLQFTYDVVVDASGCMYVGTDNKILRIEAGADGAVTGASDEIITRVAGTGYDDSGDGGPAIVAGIRGPREIVIDSDGGLLIFSAAYTAPVIRRIDPGADGVVTGEADEIITTVVGTGTKGYSGDGGPATSANIGHAGSLALDAAGNLFILTGSNRLRRIDAGSDGRITGDSDEIITTVAGGGLGPYFPQDGDGEPATDAKLHYTGTGDLFFDGGGNLFISGHTWVGRIDAGTDGVITGAADEIITAIAGSMIVGFAGDGGPASEAEFNQAGGLVLDASGNIYVADARNHRIRRITAGGVPFNEPPTAVAGLDQELHAGQTVDLDGSESYDDNTASVDLSFAWSFIERPTGSGASLTGADTATPFFDADRPGTYRVQLIVTDDEGLSSPPDEVVISSENLAPTADAGDDAAGVVGLTTVLDGSASFDPDGDPLAFFWSFQQRPADSTASLVGDGTDMPSFVPDLPGVYVVRLVVDDPFESSLPDTVTITVITGPECAEGKLAEALDYVADLPPGSVTTKGNQRALTNFLSQAIARVQAGDIEGALGKIHKSMERTDGCMGGGGPDGNGPGRDWITNCADQAVVYVLLMQAEECLSSQS